MFKFFSAVVIVWVGLATGLFRAVLYGLYELVVGSLRAFFRFPSAIRLVTLGSDEHFERYIYYSNHEKVYIWYGTYP